MQVHTCETDAGSNRWLESIRDLSGQTVLITGATDGIGKAAALAMAGKGASLIICARSADKARNLINRCEQQNRSGVFQFIQCDLAEVCSVENAVSQVRALQCDLDVIIANAGVAFDHTSVNSIGINKTFFINHIAHFALVTGLLPLLKRARTSRVVVQSSVAHYAASAHFEDYFSPQVCPLPCAYADSKLANILFVNGLRVLANKAGMTMKSIAVHPGYLVSNINQEVVSSGLLRNMSKFIHGDYKSLLLYMGYQLSLTQPSALAAALPMLHAAFKSETECYIGPGAFHMLRGMPAICGMGKYAKSLKRCNQLWSETLSFVQKNFIAHNYWNGLNLE